MHSMGKAVVKQNCSAEMSGSQESFKLPTLVSTYMAVTVDEFSVYRSGILILPVSLDCLPQGGMVSSVSPNQLPPVGPWGHSRDDSGGVAFSVSMVTPWSKGSITEGVVNGSG